ncbi:hypothetical protein ACFWXK_10195 [Streptomyces sp. NPDC059070]|uniref:hypothetical protein n=1 Tax=Streptomyces sp. NPDC059070 TaxID=3346713 RepID=UPI0036B61E5A
MELFTLDGQQGPLMDLSTPVGLSSFAQAVAEHLGTACRAPSDVQGRAELVFPDGRVLELVPNRRGTRLVIRAGLPREAASWGIGASITVSARPRPEEGETPEQAAARHTATQIRQRLIPEHLAALAELRKHYAPLDSTLERAERILSSFPDSPHGAVAVGERMVHHSMGLNVRRAVAWWRTPAGPSRAMAPFIADALRRGGLATTEPHGSGYVFFAPPPPDEEAVMRFRLVPVGHRAGVDMVDQYTGACVRTYGDAQWALGIAESAERENEAARAAEAASLDLAGLSEDLIEADHVRALAVDLAMAGYMPYGLSGVDDAETPGFLICPAPHGAVTVSRLLEPWGSVRPGTRLPAPDHEGEHYDQDLQAYASVLARPGRTVTVTAHEVHVQFDDPTR